MNLDSSAKHIRRAKELEDILNQKKEYIVFSRLNNLPGATAKNSLENDPQAEQLRKINDEDLYDYLEEAMSAVIHEITAIETFVNMLIPSDYKHIENKWYFFKVSRNKAYIERWFSLISKIELVSKIKSLNNIKQQPFWSIFMKVKKLRDQVVHLKTNGEKIGIGEVYSKIYLELIDLDLDKSLEQIIEMINFIKPDEVEQDKI